MRWCLEKVPILLSYEGQKSWRRSKVSVREHGVFFPDCAEAFDAVHKLLTFKLTNMHVIIKIEFHQKNKNNKCNMNHVVLTKPLSRRLKCGSHASSSFLSISWLTLRCKGFCEYRPETVTTPVSPSAEPSSSTTLLSITSWTAEEQTLWGTKHKIKHAHYAFNNTFKYKTYFLIKMKKIEFYVHLGLYFINM